MDQAAHLVAIFACFFSAYGFAKSIKRDDPLWDKAATTACVVVLIVAAIFIN